METLQRTANRGSLSTGYDIDNSLKLEDDNTENLYRALNGSTSTTKFTVSMWFKRTELGATQLLYMRGVAGNEAVFLRTSTEVNDALQVDIGASSTNSRSYTSQLLRDTSAWYHVVLAVDTTQSTATDRFKLYLNGNLITDFASRSNPAEDFAMEVSSAKHRHGAYNDTDGFAGYCGYIAECHYIDGSQVAQTEFGEFDDDSGIWKPKQYTGSYGTGGYYLDFSDSSALGNNSAGDGTDFTLNNITSTDQATDSPTNNFCTANVLDGTDGNIKNQEGGTKITTDGGSSWCTMMATMGITKGKWYWEAQYVNNNIFVGVADSQDIYVPYSSAAKYYLGNVADSTSVGWYFDNGQVYNGDATFTAPSADDKVMIALDWDNKAIYFGVNGTWGNSSNPESGASKTGASVYAFNNADWDNFAMPAFTVYQGNTLKINFGGYTCISISSGNSDEDGYGNFEYAPPSGYYALCTKNLAEYG